MRILYERAKHMFTDEELEKAEKDAGGQLLAVVFKVEEADHLVMASRRARSKRSFRGGLIRECSL